jgi:hypothetical protein
METETALTTRVPEFEGKKRQSNPRFKDRKKNILKMIL